VLQELSIVDDGASSAGCPQQLPYGDSTDASGVPAGLELYMVVDSVCAANGVEGVCSYLLDVCCCKDCVTVHVDAVCQGGQWQLTVDGDFPPPCDPIEPLWFQACLGCDADIVESSSVVGVAGVLVLSVSVKNEYTQCCQSCNANTQCDLWTYESASGSCIIYTNVGDIDVLDSVTAQPGVVTGVMKNDLLVPNYSEPVQCFQLGSCDVVLQAFPVICSFTDELSCSVKVLIESSSPVGAFDFVLKTADGFALPILKASGGLAEQFGFTVAGSVQKGTVIGYSEDGLSVLPIATQGPVLTTIELDVNEINAEFFADNTVVCISEVTASNSLNILDAGHPDCSAGTDVNTEVTVSLGEISADGDVPIYIASTKHLTGFQLEVMQYVDENTDPVPIPLEAASGGLAQENGFLLQVSDDGIVIGWYLGASGGIAPSGTLVTPTLLTTIHLAPGTSVEKVCLKDTFFNNGADSLVVEEPPCPPVSGIVSAQECDDLTSEAFAEGFEAGVASGQGDQDTYNQGFSDGQLIAGQSYELGFEDCKSSIVDADFSGDGEIDILDITLMIQYIVEQSGK